MREIKFKAVMQRHDNTQDRLAELEALIREWFIANGMAWDNDDWFEIKIGSRYKNKFLQVYEITELRTEHLVTATGKITKEMFDKAFEYFKLPKEA